MKRIIILVAILTLVAGVAFAGPYGDSRIGDVRLTSKAIFQSATENVGHVHITTSPTSVYRVTFNGSASNTYVQMFDSPGIGHTSTTAAFIIANADPSAGGNQFLKADIGEPTANECTVITYDPPLRFDNGVLVGFAGASANATGTAVIEYRQD